MIRENGGWHMFKMIEIKKFPCSDHNEASAEEDKTMKELKANMNSRGSTLDKEQQKAVHKVYCEQNKEKIRAQQKKYNETYKDYITELVQCECGSFMARCTKNGNRHLQTQRHKNGMKTFAPRIC